MMMMMMMMMVNISEEVRTQITAHDRTIGFHDVRLAELDLRVQCAETTNYDGILIWKIVEYQRRKREAVTGDDLLASRDVTRIAFYFYKIDFFSFKIIFL